MLRLTMAAIEKPAATTTVQDPEYQGVHAGIQIEYLVDHVDALMQLAHWHHTEWAALMPHLTIADRQDRLQASACRGGVPTSFVAVLDGQVVGSASLVGCDLLSHSRFSPWLASLTVAPGHRGRGVGSALSERVAAEAHALGFPEAYLFTFDQQDFYQRMGWRRLEEAKWLGRPVTVMVHKHPGRPA
jgi:GNAT superfamily N-acetyltransferase